MTNRVPRQLTVTATLRAQDNVITRQQALACGMTRHALEHRIRPDGPWQRLLPGVYLAQTGAPALVHKETAAFLHAAPDGVLTGPAALRLFGIATAEPSRIDVLVPMRRRPESVAFVAVHRTTRMPERVAVNGGRSYVLPARALADMAREMTDVNEVRALIAGAIQRGQCPLGVLAEELDGGRRAGSGLLRQVLAEAADGIRSPAEGDFRGLIKRSGLPEPLFNHKLYTAAGTYIATPDAWWPHAGVAVEVDSREWHLKPADWEKTMRRHARMMSHGLLVLHFSPRQIRHEPATVVAMIADTLRAGQARSALPLTARPA